MKAKVRIVSLLLGIVAALAACSDSGADSALRTHGGGRIAAVSPSSGPLLLAEVVQLNTTHVVGGEPFSGALVVSNPGGAIDLNDAHGCKLGFVVVLTNSSYQPVLAWAASCIGQPFVIPHGTTRLPVSVSTSYLGCLEGGAAAPGLPPCLASGHPPPLPPGVYQAGLVWAGPVPLPPAQPVAVTVVDTSP